ncbi:SemiSWEET family sugar transporter [Sediminibacterium sp.]|jgi:MtN3 and saliva related transmembrane protein|uniref:SemiSWEET family sugar transporter n=1 Tax=Sediminibacterium sp. TaxID=1917865 RepID=UPI0025E2E904|nr:SemiSWEET family transporter [Sediminibacterium sp.]MDO8997049.1 SemiSWEET family transporter [Sediminibacterium sp.]MDP1971866.1 SemiSWEET family transporter [Sediminibacterium sp.]MDP2421855.1 SemiSWEET family transporter [Sediminibacterium sp.]
MNLVDLLGYFGAFLSAITFIPQVLLAWKSKSVGDLSIWMILIVITSCVVWLVYAVNVKSGPVLAANLIVLALALLLFYFKLTFPPKK